MKLLVLFLLVASVALVAALQETCRNKNMISITIDDGPYLGITDNILNVLKQQKVKATFFVLGKQLTVPANVNLVKRADKEGHIIASHTYNHPLLTSLSDGQIVKEMNDTSDAIFAAINKRPRLMRPPEGALNERSRALLVAMGYQIVGWNIDTHDWHQSKKVGEIVQTVRPFVTKQASGILLFHDLYPHTYQALPEVIKMFKNNKSKIVPLDKCLNAKDVYFKNYTPMDPNNPRNPFDAQTNPDGTPGNVDNMGVDGLSSGVQDAFSRFNAQRMLQFCGTLLMIALGILVA